MGGLTLYHQEVLALHGVSADTLVVMGVEAGCTGVGWAAVLLPGERGRSRCS